MDSIELSNPYLRNGPSCHRFQSTVQLAIDRSLHKLPAIANIVAEVLTLHAYSPSRHHDYVIDLTLSEIRRSPVNRRKFVITTHLHVFNIFCNSVEDANVWESILSHSSSRQFSEYYRLGKKIANGRHSKVFQAYALNDPSAKFIVKVNFRRAESNDFLARSQFERDAHLQLIQDFNTSTSREIKQKEQKMDLEERKHRHFKLKLSMEKFVVLRDCFGTATEDFLVFEYQDGEILSTVLSNNGTLDERLARIVMWDLLNAIHFMHEQGVVHRDVRASNIFYWNRGGDVKAKLFDLSEARQIPDDVSGEEPFRDSPGKGHYRALEILSGRYHGKPADIWSCGVLLYRMLSGTFPFQGESESELRRNIVDSMRNNSLFDAPIWHTVSQEAILLIKQMLQPDPFKRPSALGARSHAWLNNENTFRHGQAGKVETCLRKRLRAPQRLETPIKKNPPRPIPSRLTCDSSVLPAIVFNPPNKEYKEEHAEWKAADISESQLQEHLMERMLSMPRTGTNRVDRGSATPRTEMRQQRETEVLLQMSSRWHQPVSRVPLRDEMCVGTYIMKSVVAATHVGLPEYARIMPVSAKLLFRSPTAQIQLSIILPYRRKLRTAALAMTAMFRIISLKKGSCLTRRISRGQPLPAELLTLLTDIRRKCHMRPLRARMPKLLPSDRFVNSVEWRQKRVEPRPKIPTVPQKFWSRQQEVKKGLMMNAWKFVKSGLNNVADGLSLSGTSENNSDSSGVISDGSSGKYRNTSGKRSDGSASPWHDTDSSTSDTGSSENDTDSGNLNQSQSDSKLGNKLRGTLQPFTSGEVENFTKRLIMA